MFAGNARNLKFRPTDGMKVICRGRVAVYEPTGQYQLYIEDMQPDGIGALSLAYEQLKKSLAEKGLFAPEHKKKIPPLLLPQVRQFRISATFFQEDFRLPT